MKINLTSGVPIYLQIVNQIKMETLYGHYRPGNRLPPVRELALELRINPNTVAKAYRLLKDEGVINSRPGGGNFVSAAKDGNAEALRQEMLCDELKSVIAKADTLGVSREYLSEIFNKLIVGGNSK